ncbi:hypothetical protein D9M73_127740 [compost metagenome]
MHEHRDIDFEDQQPSVGQFGAVDSEIIEADPALERSERSGVAVGEIAVEMLHPRRFNGALVSVLGHAGAQIMHDPMVRERQVAGIGLAADEHHALLAEQAVLSAIVDKGRDEELSALTAGEISQRGVGRVQAIESPACVRAERTRNDRKGEARDMVGKLGRSQTNRFEHCSLDLSGWRHAQRCF